MTKESYIRKISNLLIENNKSISVAESCTGGLLSDTLTSIPGSSKYFKLGIITYSNESKTKLLNIPKEKIKFYGAVSKEVSILMAKNIKKITKTDIAISVTGIAGPGGGNKSKPVGLMYISLIDNKNIKCKKIIFKGLRKQNKSNAVKEALSMLIDNLSPIKNSQHAKRK